MRFYYILLISFSLAGCSGASTQTQDSKKAIPVYNQAYQENYKSDTIADILLQAKHAYVLIDPFEENIVTHITDIRAHDNEVAGYISAGTGEKWRDDFNQLKPYLTTKVWPEWPGEFFVSEVKTGILSVMKKRIDKMAIWGLDWVEFDNMDWLDEESRKRYGLSASIKAAKSYINTLCDYTHSKGMKCMAKNTVEGFGNFDGVLYESYDDNKNWWDHADMQSFLEAGKLVIINHYNETDCDTVYAEYKTYYHSDAISFICEDTTQKKYRHYNQK